MRDTQRAAVYAVEEQVSQALQRGGVVDFFGSTLVVPAERRFADIASIQRYVDLVRDRWNRSQPGVAHLRVRERRGSTKAHYEPARGDQPAVIAVPMDLIAGTRWAARETVVLHEFAHHLLATAANDSPDHLTAKSVSAHGGLYCATLITLYEQVLGPEAALLLRSALQAAGVNVNGTLSGSSRSAQ